MKVKRTYLEYVDHASNADKFYQVFACENGVLLNYGRSCTDGQERWYASPEPEVFANKKIYEKLDKGYRRVGDPVEFEADEYTDSVARFTMFMNQARASGNLTKASDDLASKAEEFASNVASLIASVKAKLVTESEILTNIQEMEADLERTENAIGNARLGLEMARHALGASVGQ